MCPHPLGEGQLPTFARCGDPVSWAETCKSILWEGLCEISWKNILLRGSWNHTTTVTNWNISTAKIRDHFRKHYVLISRRGQSPENVSGKKSFVEVWMLEIVITSVMISSFKCHVKNRELYEVLNKTQIINLFIQYIPPMKSIKLAVTWTTI